MKKALEKYTLQHPFLPIPQLTIKENKAKI